MLPDLVAFSEMLWKPSASGNYVPEHISHACPAATWGCLTAPGTLMVCLGLHSLSGLQARDGGPGTGTISTVYLARSPHAKEHPHTNSFFLHWRIFACSDTVRTWEPVRLITTETAFGHDPGLFPSSTIFYYKTWCVMKACVVGLLNIHDMDKEEKA